MHTSNRISTHAPRTGSDSSCSGRAPVLIYFNPRSPHGERRAPMSILEPDSYFNPRSPHGERQIPLFPAFVQRHFNPRSPHGERLEELEKHIGIGISTHAPRTGSDINPATMNGSQGDFNPRSPHGERHAPRPALAIPTKKFQPTLPARGATAGCWRRGRGREISTHAPRTGSDWTDSTSWATPSDFNPRSPHGERQSVRAFRLRNRGISTHAPRTGSDMDRFDQLGNTI